MKDMIVKINKAYRPTLIKEMMEKWQLNTYAELYDKLVDEIEKRVAEMPDNVISKKINGMFDMCEKYAFVQNCLDGKEAVITKEYFNLDNIVDNVNELNSLKES